MSVLPTKAQFFLNLSGALVSVEVSCFVTTPPLDGLTPKISVQFPNTMDQPWLGEPEKGGWDSFSQFKSLCTAGLQFLILEDI